MSSSFCLCGKPKRACIGRSSQANKPSKIGEVFETVKLDSALFYSSLSLYVFSYALGNTNIGVVASRSVLYIRIAMQVVALVFLLGKLILKNYSKAEFVILCIGLALMLVCYVKTGGDLMPFVWTLLFIFGAKGEDIKVAATVFLATQVTVLVLTAVGSHFGFIPDVVWIDNGVELKSSLGFNHPNVLGVTLFAIAVSFAIMRDGSSKIFDITVYIIIAFLLFRVARARTSEIGFIALIILLILNQSRVNKKKLLIVCTLMFCIIVVVSIAIMLFYDPNNALMSKFNSLLSRRFYYWNLYASSYPPTLFGRDFNELPIVMTVYLQTSILFMVDNVYCYTLLHLGILPFLFLTSLVVLTFFKCIKTGRCDVSVLAFVAFLVFGFSESHTFWIGMNVSLLLIAHCFDSVKAYPSVVLGE